MKIQDGLQSFDNNQGDHDDERELILEIFKSNNSVSFKEFEK